MKAHITHVIICVYLVRALAQRKDLSSSPGHADFLVRGRVLRHLANCR